MMVLTLSKKRNRIISKLKSEYWTHNQKYGARIPKSFKEEIELEK